MANKDKAKEKEVTGEKEEAVVEENVEVNTENSAEATEEIDDSSKEEKKESKKKSSSKKKSAEDKLKEEIEELTLKNSEINDKYIRLSAEFDNYRRRTLKEKGDLIKTAGGDALADILPVVDDFERGLEAMDKAEDVSAVKEGVDLIYNKFKEFLKNKGISEIEAHHQDFDTDYHEALTKIPAPAEELKGKVVDVIQKGYKIEEKVIRFAKVVVGE